MMSRLEPEMSSTEGVNETVLVELTPVVSLLLTYPQLFKGEEVYASTVCATPSSESEESTICREIVYVVPVPP